MPDIWMDVDTALTEVPVNLMPLIDDTDFKTRETAVAYNAAGMDLVWNFVTTAGAFTQTAVTPTTAGNYDWTHQGDGIYTIEIPASGGASINNDTEGFGWFSGLVTGVLPFRGPVIGLRAAGLNDLLIDSTYSATRGLAGTALPAAAADAAGGLPISDAGGLDLDTLLAYLDAAISSRLASASYTTPLDAAGIRTALGLASANLDTQLGTIAGYIDTEIATLISNVASILTDTGTTLDGKIDAIKAVTDVIPDSGALTALLAAIAAIQAVTDVIPDAGAMTSIATAASIAALNNFDPTSDTVIVGTNNDKTGYSLANDAQITKNVALSNFPFFMVDETDFATPETSLTITAQISKDGGAFSACTNAAAEIANGWYKIDLTQTEMNADVILLRFTATGAAARNVQMFTQPSL